MLRAVTLGTALALVPLVAPAELDAEAYQTEAGALTEAEATAMRVRVAAEIAEERTRAEEVRRAAQAEADRIAVERAARPLGERLVEARCLTCHAASQIDRADLGAPGWTVTILRMEWLNGALLEPGERGMIVEHLAARHPERNRYEWIGLISGSVLIAALGFGALVWRRRRWVLGHAR